MTDNQFNIPGYVAYDPAYPALFDNERSRLQLFLDDSWTIEHIGSTAVPGLGGKPIVDLYVLAPAEALDTAYAYLIMAGYRLVLERAGADGHAILVHNDMKTGRRYHVHLNAEDAQDVLDVIRLRNYLRAHPADRDLLDALKRKAAAMQPTRDSTGTFPTSPK